MGKKKSKYDNLVEEMREKVQKAGSSRYSRGDQTLLTQTLMNTPEHEVEVFLKDCPDPAIIKPVEQYRESLKPVIKQFGVDGAELDKIKDVPFPKAHAEAFNDLAAITFKDYIGTGRKLILPVTGKDEAQMEISQVEKDKKVEDTRKLVEVSEGKYESVPTGDRKTTEAHKEIKAANKVPGWLISKEKISD